MTPYYEADGIALYHGNCLALLPNLPGDHFAAVVTDPPYHLTGKGKKGKGKGGFMGLRWDAGNIAFRPETWRECLRPLKPAGHVFAFGGPRTFHRLAVALEDAGAELRDTLCWLYGTGFPKGAGQLKPAWEPILLAAKLASRSAALDVTAGRLPGPALRKKDGAAGSGFHTTKFHGQAGRGESTRAYSVREYSGGRWPPNVALDEAAAAELADQTPVTKSTGGRQPGSRGERVYNGGWSAKLSASAGGFGDAGTACRFFYCPKVSAAERARCGDTHPTQKPVALLTWLARLAGPGPILDPFAGSGTTLEAAWRLDRPAVGFELVEKHCEMVARRLEAVRQEQGPLLAGL